LKLDKNQCNIALTLPSLNMQLICRFQDDGVLYFGRWHAASGR